MSEIVAVSDSFIADYLPSCSGVVARGEYTLTYFASAEGLVANKPEWIETASNLVTIAGLSKVNSVVFSALSYTAQWYLGLINGPGGFNLYANTDTMASHPGWTEFLLYSGTTRPQVTFLTPSGTSPSSVLSNSVSFIIDGAATVAGAFLTDGSFKGGNTGLLFSEANFFSPGDRPVSPGGVLVVSYRFVLSAG